MKSKDTLQGLNKPAAMFVEPKEIKVITKKVLHNIADSIHNPDTGHYLNLCAGTLQNGPDPVCKTRTMHCGLGELYFVVTGRQPEEDHVCEDDVIDEVVERSTIHECEEKYNKKIAKAKEKIRALDLPEELTYDLLEEFDKHDYNSQDDNDEDQFRNLLDSIPNENDMGEDVTKDFRARAKRVAEVLRKAADLLPR